LSLLTAYFNAPGKVLLFATRQDQSQELLRYIKGFNDGAGRPIPVIAENSQSIEFLNGARIISMCSNEAGVLGHHNVKLLCFDEASRIEDELYSACLPMRMTCKGSIVLLSTPNCRRGFYFSEWSGTEQWERVLVTHKDCPHLDPAEVETYRRTRGDRKWKTEFCGEFASLDAECCFREEDIAAAFSDHSVIPLFDEIPEKK
jgi:hypothetical protein